MPLNRPNILVFCTDQQRADHLGCAGHPLLATPNIDALAARGVRFSDCHTTYSACMPARGTMLTGLSHRACRMRSNGVGLPPEIPTVPGLLGNAGYRTHAVGKLHLRPWQDPKSYEIRSWERPDQNPERASHWKTGALSKSPNDYHGYQTMEITIGHVSDVQGDYRVWRDHEYPGVSETFMPPVEADQYRAPGGAPAWDLVAPESAHYNNWIADRSIAFLQEQDSAAPFFLWCSFPDPHAPFAGLRRWADFYRRTEFDVPDLERSIDCLGMAETLLRSRGGRDAFTSRARAYHRRMREYYVQTFAMISHIDEQIGRVTKELENLGMVENTLIIFLSDHGDQLGEHGLMHKGYWPYDGNTRVPFIMAGPTVASPGRVAKEVVSLLDMAPTLLDAAGLPQPEDPQTNDRYREQVGQLPPSLPGESLLPVLESDSATPPRGTAVIETDDELNKHFDLLQMRVLVTEKYKICHYSPTGEVVLYDRLKDPDERTDLAKDPTNARLTSRLLSQLLTEVNRTEARRPRRFTDA